MQPIFFESLEQKRWLCILKGKSDKTKLIDTYGSDFTVLQSYFPNHSRKQIKKKFDKVESRKERKQILLDQLRKNKEKRSIFEEDILGMDPQ